MVEKQTETFGETIRNKRKSMGLSIREVARRANMSHPYLSQLERGIVGNPSYAMKKVLSEVLGLHEKEIRITFDEESNEIKVNVNEVSRNEFVEILTDLLADLARKGVEKI